MKKDLPKIGNIYPVFRKPAPAKNTLADSVGIMRIKLVLLCQTLKNTAKVRTKKTIRKAKTETTDKTVKKISPPKVKKPPVAEVETDQRPLMAKQVETQPSIQKKPAIKPKSDLSTIKQPAQIQTPKAGQKSGTSDKMIDSTPTAPRELTGQNRSCWTLEISPEKMKSHYWMRLILII